MNLTARLARLEKLARGEPCPSCRLFRHRRQLKDAEARACKDPGLVVFAPCDLCESGSLVGLATYPADLREMYRLHHGSTVEDRFTNPRAWAAREGTGYWSEFATEWLNDGRRGELSRTARTQAQTSGRASDIPAADYELSRKLRAEYDDALALKRNRLAARYGERPFPALEARIRDAKNEGFGHLLSPGERLEVDIDQLGRIYNQVTPLLKCAEVDKIILGRVTPFTAALLEDCEGRATEVIVAGRREHEAAEERRREDEERERRRREATERDHFPSAPPPAPAVIAAPAPPEPARPRQMDELIDTGTIARQQRLSPPPAPWRRPPPTSPEEKDAAYASTYWSVGRPRRRPR